MSPQGARSATQRTKQSAIVLEACGYNGDMKDQRRMRVGLSLLLLWLSFGVSPRAAVAQRQPAQAAGREVPPTRFRASIDDFLKKDKIGSPPIEAIVFKLRVRACLL